MTNQLRSPLRSPPRSPLEHRRGGFNPISLFRSGEQGVIYDASDMSTLFQDSAGTTPCTAANQPVGKMLDKSGRGNHATQPTAGKRPMLGREPFGGRRNLLAYTEDFGKAVWSGTGVWGSGSVAITPNVAAPDGSMTACRVVADAPTSSPASGGTIRFGGALLNAVIGKSCWIKSNTGSNQTVTIFPGVTGAVFTVTPEWAEYQVVTPSILQYKFELGVYRNGGANDTDSSCDVLMWHPQTELGATPTPYQKVVSSFDVTEAGKGEAWRNDFDGVDDDLGTTFSDSLGSACTVAWSLPSTGASILTAQTIGTTFTNSTDSHALVIVDRALTGPETTQLTAWLNKKAGL